MFFFLRFPSSQRPIILYSGHLCLSNERHEKDDNYTAKQQKRKGITITTTNYSMYVCMYILRIVQAAVAVAVVDVGFCVVDVVVAELDFKIITQTKRPRRPLQKKPTSTTATTTAVQLK